MSRLSKEREAEIRKQTRRPSKCADLLDEIDALRAERDSKCSCGHPKVCWVRAFHGPREWGNLCVPENHTHEFCSTCRERDEAIVGAYRAAAGEACEYCKVQEGLWCGKRWRCTQAHKMGIFWQHEVTGIDGEVTITHCNASSILALPPQSALDAVERDRREIADAALKLREQFEQATWEWNHAHYPEQPKPVPPTADDVLAKVGRGR